jgi:hypothetical protein
MKGQGPQFLTLSAIKAANTMGTDLLVRQAMSIAAAPVIATSFIAKPKL